MRTRDRRTSRLLAPGLFAVAGPGLAGCGTEGYVGPCDQDLSDRSTTYAGQEVTLSAEVSETLSLEAFAIAGALDPLLILESQELPAVGAGQVVEVTGAVQDDFAVADVEEELGTELGDELFSDYAGRPYVMATSAEIVEGQ